MMLLTCTPQHQMTQAYAIVIVRASNMSGGLQYLAIALTRSIGMSTLTRSGHLAQSMGVLLPAAL